LTTTASSRRAAPAHIFSVDVECWYEILSRGGRAAGEFRGDRFDRQMDVIMALLAETNTKGTFFILASTARQRPALARQLADLGHEIGTHGSAHIALTRHTPASFRADVRDSKRLLEDQCGRPVVGHRAPMFSVVKSNLWVLDVLAECGLTIDSSVFPSRIPRFGIPSFPRRPAPARGPAGGRVFEVPLSTVEVAGIRLPVSGGSYARVMPASWLRRITRALEREGLPMVLYFHPYEFDPARLEPPPPLQGWRKHYTDYRWNIRRETITGQVRELLTAHRFGRMDHFVSSLTEND